MIDSLLINSLRTLNLPISRLKYTGDKSTFIVFQKYLEQVEGFSDDDEELIGHYYIVNLFTKGDFNEVSKNIKIKLKEVGFNKIYEAENYDNESGYYNKVFRFFYLEGVN